ncbi:MAG: acetate--CoA ligase family protein [Planctomycetes bacterium]|nr:acetate--CoA ligase family protein [Planctomycetota bacterium]
MSLEKLLLPQSVAIIGASRVQGKVGYEIVSNILSGGFTGPVHPVNPKADEILGLECFPSVAAIGGPVDLAVICLPSPAVDKTILECGKAGIRAAIVITAGFKEIGEEGRKLEDRLVRTARQAGVRILGPNCLGLISTHVNLNASFAPLMPRQGSIAMISQSGALIAGILDKAQEGKIGFSYVVSVGNKAELDEEELLRAFAADPKTRVIAGYIENITEGEKFLRTAERVVPEKPVVLVKAGSTAAGTKAAFSHTGSLAGSEAAYECAFRRSGIIRAASIEDLFDLAQAFAEQPLPIGRRIAVITNAGGPGIMAADACEKANLTFRVLSESAVQKLQEVLPAAASTNNPVDVLGDADETRYENTLRIVMSDEGVDAALVLLTPQAMTHPAETAEAIARVYREVRKTVLVSFIGSKLVEGGIEILRENGIPQFPSPERAARALQAMADYVDWCSQPPRVIHRIPTHRVRVEKTIRRHRALGQTEVGEQAAKDILEAYGFIVPESILARNVDEARSAAERIGYPVVIKIASQDISHKSDVGGVRVGLENEEELIDGFELMMLRIQRKLPEARLDGVTVQEMKAGGREVIIGMTRDPQFGPLLVFGLGGIHVEVLKDVAFELAPITEEEACAMIERTKTFKLLRGVRGEKGVDTDTIAESLRRISQLSVDFPEILELDINPLKVTGTEAIAVDGRIRLCAD